MKVLQDELTTTQLTGHLILLVDVCTNLVHKDVEGLLGYAFGGRSCTRDILSLRTPYIPNSPPLHRLSTAARASVEAHTSSLAAFCATVGYTVSHAGTRPDTRDTRTKIHRPIAPP